MVKVGQLVLDEGRWRDRQIVSSAWIRQSTAVKVPMVGAFGSHSLDYGYLWWILNPSDVIAAVGARGQFIFISRQDRVVVAVTGENTGANWSSPVDFFYSDILAAIR
jgi:CubicO group peptidase (beta-lactamase class C family)